MKTIIKNKKADIPSLIIGLIAILFALGIGGILFAKVFLAVTNEMKQQPDFSNNTIGTLETVESKTVPFLDYLFFFSFVGLSIGLIVSSIYLHPHPALTIIFIVALIIATVLAGIFANAFVEVGEDAEIIGTYNQFALTKVIINNLPIIVFAVGTIVVIILYGKGRTNHGQEGIV